MDNNEVLNRLTNAKIYYKQNKKTFKRFFPLYRIVNNRVLNAVESFLIIVFLGCVIFAGLDFFGVIGDISETIRSYMIIATVVSCVFIGSKTCLRKKQDEMYEKYSVYDVIATMHGYMCGLNYVFWKRKYIKKLIKLISTKKAKDLKEAVTILKPKCKEVSFDTEKFEAISADAIKRQNEQIEKYNKKIQKSKNSKRALRKAQKKEIKKAMKNAFWESVVESILFKPTEYTNIEVPTMTYGNSPQPAQVNSSNNSSKKAEEERKRQLADYAKQADWWDAEYRRLYSWDPNHYKTKDAEYNKNYFRRLSRGG